MKLISHEFEPEQNSTLESIIWYLLNETSHSSSIFIHRPSQSSLIVVNQPSYQSVLGAVLDLSTLSCACLICFTVASAEGGRYIHTNTHLLNNNDNNNSYDNNDNPWMEEQYLKYFCEATAPLFPLGLFCVVGYKALFPWKTRGRVWITLVGMTVGAPFYEVTFR